MRFDSVTAWLDWQEGLNPKEIDLGLDRVEQVAERLGLLTPTHKIISIAGTNGKGSCAAMLSAIYHAAGYRVGTYTSPHVFHYQERIQINQQQVDDASLMAAFQQVDDARQSIPLTYFEFGTLAALLIFSQSQLDVAILEVGLGGRLDAVNVMDADVSVITSIDIDHVDWLGNDRESIATEKLGIARENRPLICGDLSPPAIIKSHTNQLHVPLDLIGRDFTYHLNDDNSWSWSGRELYFEGLSIPALMGMQQLQNAATCLAVVVRLASILAISKEQINRGLQRVSLPGRMQTLSRQPHILCDVAHNPHSVTALAAYLANLNTPGQVVAVFGVMKDKDIQGILQAIINHIDEWLIAPLQSERSADRELLETHMRRAGITHWSSSDRIAPAFQLAKDRAGVNDLIVVFGSFQTVAELGSISAESSV